MWFSVHNYLLNVVLCTEHGIIIYLDYVLSFSVHSCVVRSWNVERNHSYNKFNCTDGEHSRMLNTNPLYFLLKWIVFNINKDKWSQIVCSTFILYFFVRLCSFRVIFWHRKLTFWYRDLYKINVFFSLSFSNRQLVINDCLNFITLPECLGNIIW